MFVIRQVMDMRSSPPKIMTQNWFPKNEFVKKKKKKHAILSACTRNCIEDEFKSVMTPESFPFQNELWERKADLFRPKA